MELNKARRPVRSVLLGLMEPVMVMGLGLHQLTGCGRGGGGELGKRKGAGEEGGSWGGGEDWGSV